MSQQSLNQYTGFEIIKDFTKVYKCWSNHVVYLIPFYISAFSDKMQAGQWSIMIFSVIYDWAKQIKLLISIYK